MAEQRDSQAQPENPPVHCDEHDLYYDDTCWKCVQEKVNAAHVDVSSEAAPYLAGPQEETEPPIDTEQTVESALVIIAKMRELIEAQPENLAEFKKMLGVVEKVSVRGL